jgi:hypothetical protein
LYGQNKGVKSSSCLVQDFVTYFHYNRYCKPLDMFVLTPPGIGYRVIRFGASRPRNPSSPTGIRSPQSSSTPSRSCRPHIPRERASALPPPPSDHRWSPPSICSLPLSLSLSAPPLSFSLSPRLHRAIADRPRGPQRHLHHHRRRGARPARAAEHAASVARGAGAQAAGVEGAAPARPDQPWGTSKAASLLGARWNPPDCGVACPEVPSSPSHTDSVQLFTGISWMPPPAASLKKKQCVIPFRRVDSCALGEGRRRGHRRRREENSSPALSSCVPLHFFYPSFSRPLALIGPCRHCATHSFLIAVGAGLLAYRWYGCFFLLSFASCSSKFSVRQDY